MTVKVHQVVRIAGSLSIAKHRLHPGQRRRAAEVEEDVSLERICGVTRAFVVRRGSMNAASPGRLTM